MGAKGLAQRLSQPQEKSDVGSLGHLPVAYDHWQVLLRKPQASPGFPPLRNAGCNRWLEQLFNLFHQRFRDERFGQYFVHAGHLAKIGVSYQGRKHNHRRT